MGRFDYVDLRGTIRDPAEHEEPKALKCPMGIECGDAYQCADHDICIADFSCTCTFEYPQCVCRGSTNSGGAAE